MSIITFHRLRLTAIPKGLLLPKAAGRPGIAVFPWQAGHRDNPVKPSE